MRYIIISMIFGAALISACSKSLDPGTTTAVKVANEWWVNNKAGDDMIKISTYNTASNPDSIWINSLDTAGAEYRIQCKMKVDLSTFAFSTQNAQNFNLHKTNAITISNGIILPKVGHSKSGNPTDSIYLELQYSDDPGKTYKVSGHARTMFEEDEY
jgi:hypothetical protein